MPDSPAPTPSTPGPATPPAKEGGKRAPLLKDKDDAISPPPKPSPSPRAAARQAAAVPPHSSRQKASSGAPFSAFLLLLMLNLALVGGAVWFYQERVAPKLESQPLPPAAVTEPAGAQVDLAPLQTALTQANGQIQELQKQLDAQRVERERAQGRLQEMADRMALVLQQNSSSTLKDSTAVTDPGQGQMATLLPSVSPSTSELILLKERNRLAGFADTAIATGNRAALQRIVDVMLDPEMKHLLHAAQAEYKRVQAYYEISISIDPNYKLPVRELFKDGAVQAEADVTPEQLQKLMLDPKQPWETRLRCAYLLRSSTAPGTDDALLKAIKEDPSLDVAKQAQTSLERRAGRRFRLFDIPAIEAWWQAQGSQKIPPVPMKEPGNESR